MIGRKKFIILLVLFSIVISGCSFSEKTSTLSEKASTLKEDLVNITTDQISQQLENSLNEEFPGIQVNSPGVIRNGQVNWDELKKTELANYVFYSIGDYEFRAVLSGDGKFLIERFNHTSGESYSYAEFKVEMVNGKFQVTTK